MAAKILVASSNQGKLREFRSLATDSSWPLALELFPEFDQIPAFDESAPTFSENSVGKALHYSHHTHDYVLGDDSGLVVPALDGRPGVLSARYAGANATSAQKIDRLLDELRGKTGAERDAHFTCALSLAHQGRAVAVITARVDGSILDRPSGSQGFGYDPVFFFPPLQKSFAELTAEEKNQHSHRGKAFRHLLAVLPAML